MINVSAEELKKLQALAAVNERSVAAEARIAIRQYLEAQKTTTRRD